ncbi:MAG TPA: hypothetical protein VME92_16375 [Acetobacteraceae bacterium]|nr:hypothetical protein [Acetobacteraceae bacterium]
MMHFAMHPDMVYDWPVWSAALLLIGGAVLGAVVTELLARRLLGVEFRRRHNDAAAAMFSVVGVTYAVLLAFIATLSWEGFDKAEAAAYAEAAAAQDVADVLAGFGTSGLAMRTEVADYLRAVVTVEWPAQAQGREIDAGSDALRRLGREALALHPASLAEMNLDAALLQSVQRLRDARQVRLLAARGNVPGIVWAVVILGGGLTILCGSLLGVASLRMHLALSAILAASGGLVLLLILALSNPFRGEFRVSTAPFDQVLRQMVAAP